MMIEYIDTSSVVAFPNLPLWKILAAEFVGTTMFIFIAAITAAPTGRTTISHSVATGLALLALIYVFTAYSGAHFNPIVSFGFMATGWMSWEVMIAYWIMQFLASIVAAALVVYFLGPDTNVGSTIGSLTNTAQWKAVLFEAVLTFFLVLCILVVTYKPELNSVSGIIIGFIILTLTLMGDALTGASLNPARSFGPALLSGNLPTYWIYVLGPLIGGIIAIFIYKCLLRTNQEQVSMS